MKTLNRISLFAVALVLLSGVASAQLNFLTQTSLAAPITATTAQFNLTSTTGITASPVELLYVDREAMLVLAVNGVTVTVQRGQDTTKAVGHVSGAMVLAGHPDWFVSTYQTGSCTTANMYASPTLDVVTGLQWLCSSVLGYWVPGFQNTAAPAAVTGAVASAAGPITPSGPLFHVTGTAAITGFNIPVGFAYGSFTIIPDGAFTTTTAGNIGSASTAIVNKELSFRYDGTSGKFIPSY